MRLNADKMATVASSLPSTKEEIMALFNVTVQPYNDKSRPWLNFVVSVYHPTKPRKRFFRRTRGEADALALEKRVEVDNLGLQALEMTARQRIECLDAYERIKPFNISLPEVVADFVKRKQCSNRLVPEAVRIFIQSRVDKKRSDRHLETLNSRLGRFARDFAETRMVDATVQDIQDWLHSLKVGARTTNHFRASLHSLFQHAWKKQKVVTENPITEIEKETVQEGKVEIFTPEEIRTLLNAACESCEHDVIATLILGAFAGIRPEEIAQLSWSAIDIEHGQIDCGAELTKTAKQRYVKIEPVLDAWLRLMPSGIQVGIIQKKNFRIRFDRVRRNAGYGVYLPDEPLNPEMKYLEWPHDGARHSYASYHYAKFKNSEVLAAELGHENTTMLFQNYRERVKAATADAWWALMPGDAK